LPNSLYFYYNANVKSIPILFTFDKIWRVDPNSGGGRMNIAIIGAGATGLLIAALLSRGGHKVTCYVRREEQKQTLENYGLHYLPEKQTITLTIHHVKEMKEHELYIFCLKQPHLKKALSNVLQQIPEHAPLLFLQNGLSHIPLVKSLNQPVFIGVLSHGAKKINDFTVEHTGEGIIKIGAIQPYHYSILKKMVEKLEHPFFPIQIDENWEGIVKEKLVVNAVINPLTALFDIKNGEILSNHYLLSLAKTLCAEACDVLNLEKEKMWGYVESVIKATSINSSSMREDIRNNRETEIEAISGYLLQTSKKTIPYTNFIYQSIKALEVKGE
jgi:2-dehydropantoate 2-reductase